jgi:hypothetical protein
MTYCSTAVTAHDNGRLQLTLCLLQQLAGTSLHLPVRHPLGASTALPSQSTPPGTGTHLMWRTLSCNRCALSNSGDSAKGIGGGRPTTCLTHVGTGKSAIARGPLQNETVKVVTDVMVAQGVHDTCSRWLRSTALCEHGTVVVTRLLHAPPPLFSPPASQASILSRALTKDITQAGSLVELQDIAEANADQLDAIHVAAIFTRAVTLTSTPQAAQAVQEARQCLAELVPLWVRLLANAPMTSVSMVLLGASKLALGSEQLWSTTLAHVVQNHKQTTGFDVCNIVYAAARAAAANHGQVPGVPRKGLVAAVRVLLRRMHVIVLAPREGDRLSLLSITNCMWALARVGITPEPEQLTDLVVRATRPELLGTANAASYANLLWSLAMLQAKPQLWGKWQVPASAVSALLADDKVLMVARADSSQTKYMLHSLGLLVRSGALQRSGAVQAAGLTLLTAMEARSDWAGRDPAAPLWGAAVLGLPVERLLAPDLQQQLLDWVPRAKGQYIVPLAELLVLTGWRHEGLLAAVLRAACTANPKARPDEALVNVGAIGAAVAHHNFESMAGQLVDLVKSKAELSKPGVSCTPHTWQQLRATQAWLSGQQQLRGGRGLTGLVHPSLLQGGMAAGGAAEQAPERVGGPSRSRSSSNGGGTGSVSSTNTHSSGGSSSSSSSSRNGTDSSSSSSSSAVRPVPPAPRAPFGASSRQLLPRPQR